MKKFFEYLVQIIIFAAFPFAVKRIAEQLDIMNSYQTILNVTIFVALCAISIRVRKINKGE